MKRRKRIGLILAMPEAINSKRILEGVFCQCQKYDYDVLVFAPMVNVENHFEKYLKGELNIFELINFEELDGVIIDSAALLDDGDDTILKNICARLKAKCKKPVISLSMPLEDYQVAWGNDEAVFRQVIEHVLDVHKVSECYFLTGFKDLSVSEERAGFFKKIMKERGLTVSDNQIFYGDFWYSSGAELADKIINKEVEMPQAVICASDHMAIGLVKRLQENGIRVPEDIIVTGFEATQAAAINIPSITSVESNMTKTAADAVDLIHKALSPDALIQPFDVGEKNFLHAGMSCGCKADALYSARTLYKESFYCMERDYSGGEWMQNIDIGLFMESYSSEYLSSVNTPQECMEEISNMAYLIRPYEYFSLCLKENWLDIEKENIDGYPEKMKLVIDRTQQETDIFAEEEKGKVFETKLMLPRLHEESPEHMVYYFSPVHFKDKALGYAVLQRTLREPKKPGIVYRNWLRIVNSGLEMVRAKNKLRELSIYDEMTGVYNRRGMHVMLEKMLAQAEEGANLFAAVVDMDGLKFINDNFGHGEGDFGIKAICSAVVKCARVGEICVRAGGDEFFILGVGKYEESELVQRPEHFDELIEQVRKNADKSYLISASMGCVMTKVDKNLDVDSVMSKADVEMYRCKVERKRQRG